MKFHSSLVTKIMSVYDMWGGRSDNKRLIDALSNLEIVEYTQQDGGVTVLVSKEELDKQIAAMNQAKQQFVR